MHFGQKPLDKFYFKDISLDANSLDKPLKISNQSNGKAIVIGYTVINDSKGPKAILYVEDLNNDRKILISRDNKYINDMEKNEWVGKNRFQWQILGLIFALSINAESNTLDLSLKNHKEHFEKIALNLWEVAELDIKNMRVQIF